MGNKFLSQIVLMLLALFICSGQGKQRFEDVYERIDVNKLGRGAQGEVFKVVRKDDPSGQVYAAKTYFEKIYFDDAFVKHYKMNMTKIHQQHGQNNNSFGRDELQRELAAYKRLPNNEHVTQLIDYFEEEDKRYMVMKLIDGVVFKKVLVTKSELADEDGWHNRTQNKYDMNHILNWAMQLSDIILVLNEAGIVYGDFHDGNMMLRKDGKLVLIDFGYTFTLNYFGEPVNPNDLPAKEIPKNQLANKTIPLLDINAIKLGHFFEQLYNSSIQQGPEMDQFKQISQIIKDIRSNDEPTQRMPSIQWIKDQLHQIMESNDMNVNDNQEILDLIAKFQEQSQQDEQKAKADQQKESEDVVKILQ